MPEQKVTNEDYHHLVSAFIKGTALCPLRFAVSRIFMAKTVCDLLERGLSYSEITACVIPDSELKRILAAKKKASTNKLGHSDHAQKVVLKGLFNEALLSSITMLGRVQTRNPNGGVPYLREAISYLEETIALLRKSGVYDIYRALCLELNARADILSIISRLVDMEIYLEDKPSDVSRIIKTEFSIT